MLHYLEKYVRCIEKGCLAIGGVLLMLLMFLGAGDVIGRYFFNKPIQGTLEASEILMAGIILLGWAYTMQIDGHIKVDLFISHYSQRSRRIVNLIALILGLLLFSLIFWQSLIFAIQYVNENRVFQILPGPSGPYHFFVPVGALLMCFELIIQIIHNAQNTGKGGLN